MKRVLFLTIAVLAFVVSAVGQTKLNADQQEQTLRKFNAATASMKSMQCDFVQTKKMKLMKTEMQSKGVMFFVDPGKLRWEYKTPYSYIFILNGDKVHIKSTKATQNIDVQRNKVFRQISNIILNSITGGHLKSSADFSVEIWKNKETYSARLYPKKKELKKLYKIIEITFNPALTMVKTIKMEETTGDVTIVNLNNVKTNTNISESVFSIR